MSPADSIPQSALWPDNLIFAAISIILAKRELLTSTYSIVLYSRIPAVYSNTFLAS